jgi:hypothetical protein
MATLLRVIRNISGKGMVTAPKVLARNNEKIKIPPSSNETQTSRLARLSLKGIFLTFDHTNFESVSLR